MTIVRQLNEAGMAQFRSYLEQLAAGASEPTPTQLLSDSDHSEALNGHAEVETSRSRRSKSALSISETNSRAWIDQKLTTTSDFGVGCLCFTSIKSVRLMATVASPAKLNATSPACTPGPITATCLCWPIPAAPPARPKLTSVPAWPIAQTRRLFGTTCITNGVHLQHAPDRNGRSTLLFGIKRLTEARCGHSHSRRQSSTSDCSHPAIRPDIRFVCDAVGADSASIAE